MARDEFATHMAEWIADGLGRRDVRRCPKSYITRDITTSSPGTRRRGVRRLALGPSLPRTGCVDRDSLQDVSDDSMFPADVSPDLGE